MTQTTTLMKSGVDLFSSWRTNLLTDWSSSSWILFYLDLRCLSRCAPCFFLFRKEYFQLSRSHKQILCTRWIKSRVLVATRKSRVYTPMTDADLRNPYMLDRYERWNKWIARTRTMLLYWISLIRYTSCTPHLRIKYNMLVY